MNKFMLKSCYWLSVLLFFNQLLFIKICYAWKPISSSSAFTSTFSIKQTHPELAGKAAINSHDSAEISALPASLPKTRILYGSHSGSSPSSSSSLSSESGEVIPITLPSLPSYKYEEDDHFGYNLPTGPAELSESVYGQKHCSVKKFALNHDGVVEYKNELPQLNQFTICFWTRYTNHTGDHVLLTYSAGKENPRAIQFWVANSMNSSFVSMAIKGQQVYRLNYPLRMRKWHHLCSSWNGKTGEWQVWLKSERIGRGFHNALVGHKIPAKGKLFSGGLSMTGEVSQGLHFEITFIQIYRIALSAGKAHRDHKHHHAHHFDHEGQELSTTTRPPPVINRPQPMHTLLANGQIPTRVRINLARPNQQSQLKLQQQQQLQQPQIATLNTNFINGQLHGNSRIVSQQLLGLHGALGTPGLPLVSPTSSSAASQSGNNVQFIDETETRIFFKRQAADHSSSSSSSNGSDDDKIDDAAAKSTIKLRRASRGDRKSNEKSTKIVKKRELVFADDGTIVDDSQQLHQHQQQPKLQRHPFQQQTLSTVPTGASATDYIFDGLAEFGDQDFKHGLTTKQHQSIDDEVLEHDREPAEEEVRAVMSLCSACEQEPFQGAIVLAWKDIIESMDNALKGYTVGACGDF